MSMIPSNNDWTSLSKYKDSLVLTPEQQQLIVGSTLGDLYIRQIGKYSRLVFEQKNKEYLFHLYDSFRDFTRTPPKERLQKRLPTSDIKSTWYFSTISHPLIHDYRLLFYPDNKKIIPASLESLITPRSLAYWYMDDGSLHNNSFSISTAGFTYDENRFLVNTLKSKFNISSTIWGHNTKNNYLSLYILQESSYLFFTLIEPYIVPSMSYKLGSFYQTINR